MKERPILFSGPMIRALLDGRKSQTRRVVKTKENMIQVANGKVYGLKAGAYPCPYGDVGDHLWCRETFVIESPGYTFAGEVYPPPFTDGRPTVWHDDPEGHWWEQCHYRATDPTPELAYEDTDEPACRWRPSIFMPRWASRITLEITDVRVEHVQSISDDDVIAEGAFDPRWTRVDNNVQKHYQALWDSINGKRGHGWDTNPWVFAIAFKRVTP